MGYQEFKLERMKLTSEQVMYRVKVKNDVIGVLVLNNPQSYLTTANYMKIED